MVWLCGVKHRSLENNLPLCTLCRSSGAIGSGPVWVTRDKQPGQSQQMHRHASKLGLGELLGLKQQADLSNSVRALVQP